MGELARAGRTAGTRASYERYLFKLVGQLERSRPDVDIREVTTNDCRAFLDQWNGCSPSTVCTIHSALTGLFGWLYLESEIEANPMVRIKRPRRPRPEDLDVVIVTRADVERMLAACETWQELLCLSVLAYTGVRRASASGLRWRDVDLVEGTARFREKGSKVAVKPLSNELLMIVHEACESAEVRWRPDDYVIPNRRPSSVRREERSDKVIWETVRKVAARAGVKATVHALRRAFAVAFLESHPGALESLQALMNHSRIDTTQVYLKALNRTNDGGRSRPLLGSRITTGYSKGAYGIRTRAAAVRGRCPRPLDECARRIVSVATASFGCLSGARRLRAPLGARTDEPPSEQSSCHHPRTVIYIWVRATVDWQDEEAFLAQLSDELRPKVEVWNATFTIPYHLFRHELREIARLNLSRVENVVCAPWGEIPEGAIVLPVDDDDWFAPDVALAIESRYDPDAIGYRWPSGFLQVPVGLGHHLYLVRRRILPFTPEKWLCMTNNYAVRKREGVMFEGIDIARIARSHLRAHEYFKRGANGQVKTIERRLSLMNRNLASQTTLGLKRSSVTRAQLVSKLRQYRRLYRKADLRGLEWALPYVELMAELTGRVGVREAGP
jgi:integrase